MPSGNTIGVTDSPSRRDYWAVIMQANMVAEIRKDGELAAKQIVGEYDAVFGKGAYFAMMDGVVVIYDEVEDA